MNRFREYEFTAPDGGKCVEIVDTDCDIPALRQIEDFKSLHGAVKAVPVKVPDTSVIGEGEKL